MAWRNGTRRTPKPAPRPERRVAFGRGISGESRAIALLIAHGYRILARRCKSPLGDIGIFVARRRTLIFIEVKVRDA
jgi:Holliday junction resolvase-like predicted endonuclease